MNAPSLQQAMDQAGGPMKLLWKPGAPNEVVPVVPPEFEGRYKEQYSWEDAVAFFDLSHHMADLFIEGPDVIRLLSDISANNYEKFMVGQAKQFVAVADNGYLIQDAIIMRLGEQKFNIIGIGGAANWISYHAQNGYDVEVNFDPPSNVRHGDPVLFRYQVQGPNASALLNELFGHQLDDIKFFHFREVQLEGRTFVGLRHGMAGQAGFEFSGDWQHAAFVKDRILEAGERHGLKQVGGLAYYTTGVDSGWLATPVPAIYTSPALRDYREFVSLYSYEGMNSLHGSFYSPNIEDYYHSPYELGYGRSISFNHEFIGREALQRLKNEVRRTKVTLVWNREDVARVFGTNLDATHSYTKDRVEKDGELVGLSQYAAYIDPAREVHSLAVIDVALAVPGTELSLAWGEHPGPNAPADFVDNFERIRVTVQPAPINEHARTDYRAD